MVKKTPQGLFWFNTWKVFKAELSPLSSLSPLPDGWIGISHPCRIFWGGKPPLILSLFLYKRLTRFKRYPLYIVRSEQSS